MNRRDERACLKRFSLKSWLLISLTLSLLPFITALALPLAKPVSRYVHTVWRTDDGLPQNYVVGIVQTRDGYLWLATQEGIARFDGSKFTVFDKRNTEQIKDNNIQTLYEDRAGNLWFGTEAAVLCGTDTANSRPTRAPMDCLATSLTPSPKTTKAIFGSARLKA